MFTCNSCAIFVDRDHQTIFQHPLSMHPVPVEVIQGGLELVLHVDSLPLAAYSLYKTPKVKKWQASKSFVILRDSYAFKSNVMPLLTLWLTLAMIFLCQDPYSGKRASMVHDQIQARGVNHATTLQAMRKVPRHLFVPESLHSIAYEDYPLPIGYGQTISQPYIVAYMTSVVAPEPDFKVLEIGTGSGYQAAVLAEIVDSVFTIEIIRELAVSAEQKLKQLNYNNIFVKNGDGYAGWKEHAPFDAIIVTAGAEEIPPPLAEQLKEGGKMVIPVGPAYAVQSLILVSKKNGKITKKNLMPVRFVPFTRDKEIKK